MQTDEYSSSQNSHENSRENSPFVPNRSKDFLAWASAQKEIIPKPPRSSIKSFKPKPLSPVPLESDVEEQIYSPNNDLKIHAKKNQFIEKREPSKNRFGDRNYDYRKNNRDLYY